VNGVPAWLPAVHLLSAALSWGLCLALALAFGVHIGLAAFVVIEFRAVMTVTTRKVYAAAKGGAQ
jgi:hypothetical protein